MATNNNSKPSMTLADLKGMDPEAVLKLLAGKEAAAPAAAPAAPAATPVVDVTPILELLEAIRDEATQDLRKTVVDLKAEVKSEMGDLLDEKIFHLKNSSVLTSKELADLSAGMFEGKSVEDLTKMRKAAGKAEWAAMNRTQKAVSVGLTYVLPAVACIGVGVAAGRYSAGRTKNAESLVDSGESDVAVEGGLHVVNG